MSNRFRLGILQKILLSFLFISVVPLMILAYIANKNLNDTGLQALRTAEQMGQEDLKHTENVGETSIGDSVRALDRKSTEAIELRTIEVASRIADFLYERDKDVLTLAAFAPDAKRYLDVYRAAKRDVIVTDSVTLPKDETGGKVRLEAGNPENKTEWRHMPPVNFKRVAIPLYREITFVDLNGHEQIKVADGSISSHTLLDVSKTKNTYCKAEDYFHHLNRLKKGEIFVSDVVGAYVPGWLYKTDSGLKVKPESAYSGKENPKGGKFEGLIRWATPVYDKEERKIGYVTMALDHTHVMEFTDHVAPTEERFTALSDGGSGNYAFIWGHQDRCIAHARDFFICGYDPQTGKRVPGWLSQSTFDKYKRSGLSLEEFAARLPSFRDFTQKKTGALEQVKAGRIPLDCRILDTAPQCEGWHRGTEDGGSGSFLILWSGLWKLTTYATIPYYTGQYGKTKRGFGYVTIGANVDDFHKDTNITKAKIVSIIAQARERMAQANAKARNFIERRASDNRRMMMVVSLIAGIGIAGTSVVISLNITNPIRRLNEKALDMSKGNFSRPIDVKSSDEIGQLTRTFNEMAKSLSELDKMKSEFVTTASHELRTPIQAMLLSISGVLDGYSGQIDDEVREDLQLARIGIERLMRLVGSLLDLSRMEARKTDLTIDHVPIRNVVERAIAEVRGLADAHRHTLHYASADGTIQADKDRVIQLLVNLLSNAIKYNPDGGSIVLRVEEGAGTIRFIVADNGYGVPDWAQSQIFDKFYQADSIMSQKVGGTGLGLAITKEIVEMHHGSIVCESPLPEGQFRDLVTGGERKGSIFTVTLPVSRIYPLIEGHGVVV